MGLSIKLFEKDACGNRRVDRAEFPKSWASPVRHAARHFYYRKTCLFANVDKCYFSKKSRVSCRRKYRRARIRFADFPSDIQSLLRQNINDFNMPYVRLNQVQVSLLFKNLIITLQKSPSICFWLHSWFVPDSSKLDSAHLSYQQGFVVQFPRNTSSL